MTDNKPTIEDVYRLVRKSMEELSSKSITSEQANAMANLANAAVNAGKLECKFIDTVGGQGTGFMPDMNAKLPLRERMKLVGPN